MSINFSIEELEYIEYAVNRIRAINSPIVSQIKTKINTDIKAQQSLTEMTTKLGSPRRSV